MKPGLSSSVLWGIIQSKANFLLIPHPEQDSSVLEMRVEEMLCPSVLENVLQRKVLLFLAGDESEQSFHPGSCDHQISHLELIRWQYS